MIPCVEWLPGSISCEYNSDSCIRPVNSTCSSYGSSCHSSRQIQINLSWNANNDGGVTTKYNVYRNTTAGFTVNTATDTPIATPSTNSYNDTGLTSSTTYYYRVAGVNASNFVGTPSDIASATTATGPDTTPPTVSSTTPANNATGIAVNTKVTIVFNEPMQSSTVTWQNISFRNTATNTSVNRAVGLASDNITCTVTPNPALVCWYIIYSDGFDWCKGFGWKFNVYGICVFIHNGIIWTAYSSCGSSCHSSRHDSINLSWSANATATGTPPYKVYRSTTAGFTVNTATDTPIATPSTNSYNDTGLTPSTTYYYRVAGVNASGTGTPSDIASATTATGSDTTPPTVSSTTPANNATGIAVNTKVTIVFSEPMQSSTIIWQNISFRNAATNTSVNRAVGLATDNKTCTVTPTAALAAGTKYTVTVLTGVKDLAGNSMSTAYAFSFTTA